MKRRDFIHNAALGTLAAGTLQSCFDTDNRKLAAAALSEPEEAVKDNPVVISTWNHGIPANQKAWDSSDDD